MWRFGIVLLIVSTLPLLRGATDGNVWKKWRTELRRQFLRTAWSGFRTPNRMN